jgi:large subunit ribosomal protein L35
MAYKFKPRKSIAKRFRVTGTGKLKHERTMRRHLLSGRSSDMKREMARPAIMSEGHAVNYRMGMGLSKLKPNRAAHKRRQNAARASSAA